MKWNAREKSSKPVSYTHLDVYKRQDKKVAKMTRDGLTEENLRDGSVKDISHRSRGRPENKEEFVPERCV